MENQTKEQAFNFTYSAKEQEEVKRIREKYIPREENKMEQLRRMDRKVTEKGTKYSIAVGIVGALVMGLGMSCALVWQGVWFVPGIFIGLAGIGIAAMALPLYNHIVKREREKIAPEILRLTEELLK